MLNAWGAKHVPWLRARELLQEVLRDPAGLACFAESNCAIWPRANCVMPSGKVPSTAHMCYFAHGRSQFISIGQASRRQPVTQAACQRTK